MSSAAPLERNSNAKVGGIQDSDEAFGSGYGRAAGRYGGYGQWPVPLCSVPASLLGACGWPQDWHSEWACTAWAPPGAPQTDGGEWVRLIPVFGSRCCARAFWSWGWGGVRRQPYGRTVRKRLNKRCLFKGIHFCQSSQRDCIVGLRDGVATSEQSTWLSKGAQVC